MSNQDRICVQKIFASPAAVEKLDKINNATTADEYDDLSAAFFSEKLWEIDATVRIKFMQEKPFVPRTKKKGMDTVNGPIDPLQQYFFDNPDINLNDAVKKIVKERIEPLVRLNFVFLDNSASNEESDVRIDFNESGGCWSLLGTDALEAEKDVATMSFSWFDVSTVIHEFGHLLGMIHEHQNPSGKGIDWNKDAVYNWAVDTQGWGIEQTDTNILNKYNRNDINGSDFDPLSIMLYFFPAKLTNDGKGTAQNLRLSGNDMTYIAKNYSDKTVAKVAFKEMYNGNIDKNMEMSNQMRNARSNRAILIIIAILVPLMAAGIYWIFFAS
jgi:hypothetical protein